MGRGALWTPSPASRRRPLDVVGLGENSLDHVCLVDGHPSAGAKVPIASYSRQPGGQISTAVLGCARLGLRTAYLGSVGDDGAASVVLAPLARAGVDLSGVRRTAGAATRFAVVLVDRESGDRTVLAHRDPRLALAPGTLRRAEIERGRVLLLDASDPDLAVWAAGVARSAGIPVVLDADALWPRAEELLARVDFPLVAREFAEELSGTGAVDDGLRVLSELGCRLPVVTLGDRGSLARTPEGELASPAFRVKVRDTTGAGDAFHAGFVWGLLQELDAVSVLRAAHATAALNCEALGAQGGLPSLAELKRFQTGGEREGRPPAADPVP